MTTKEKVSTDALRELTTKGWADHSLVPKASINLIADELDTLREAIRKIALLETTMSDMCRDDGMRPDRLAMAGLRDAVRIAKAAL
jgi:hypothetical protein